MPEAVRISVSQILTDEFCPRKWYWEQLYAGGIEPVGEGVEFVIGTVVHAAILENLGTSPDAGMRQARAEMEAWCQRELIVEPLRTQYPAAAAAMVYNWLATVWAELAEEYDVEQWEGETECRDWEEPWITWTARPDLLLRHRKRKTLRYGELKTFGGQADKFCKIWDQRLQIHLADVTVNATLGERLEDVVVYGIKKPSTYKGELRGPLVTAYINRNNGKIRLDSQKGYERFLVQEYEGGIPGWVRKELPYEVRCELTPCTTPILPDFGEIEETLVRQRHRARERQQVREAETPEQLAKLMALFVPKFRSNCINPVTGKGCIFNEACHNKAVNRDPLGSGLYQRRQDRAEVDSDVTE